MRLDEPMFDRSMFKYEKQPHRPGLNPVILLYPLAIGLAMAALWYCS